MTDLVERLREMRPDFIQESHAIMHEAANEIERQQRRIDELENAIAYLRSRHLLHAEYCKELVGNRRYETLSPQENP